VENDTNSPPSELFRLGIKKVGQVHGIIRPCWSQVREGMVAGGGGEGRVLVVVPLLDGQYFFINYD
jgi:hypothetical protein